MCKLGIYLVCDYPNREKFLEAVRVCEDFKIDFLEIGFPFSDPVADGDAIEQAAFDVLQRENTNDFVDRLKEVRAIFSKKLYVMTYANVVFGYGSDRLAKDIECADGIIIADLPYVESKRFKKPFEKYGVNLIHFVTPESTKEDMDKIKNSSKDFVYFVSMRGTTGGRLVLDDELKSKLEYMKFGFNKDVILGFGIKDKIDIKNACEYSDGVVIGSEAVRNLNNNSFYNYIESLF